MKFICHQWSYHEGREGKHLLIWSDLPRWMVVDKELYSLLKKLNGDIDLNEIINDFSKESDKNFSEMNNLVNDTISKLIELGIIYKKGEYRPIIKEEDWKIEDISINITTRCNLNCKMCFNKYDNVSPEDEITSEEIKDFLDQILKFTYEHTMISITGGEALLVPDKTIDVAKYAKKKGFKQVSIITNGTLINREFAKKVKELDLKIMVSIDGSSEEEHDALRGAGNFKKTIEGIKILKEEGVYVTTNHIVHKGNISSLNDYYKMALDLGVDKARFISLKKMGGGADDDTLEFVPIDELLKIAYNLFQDHPEYKNITGIELLSVFANQCRLSNKRGWCGTGRNVVLLDADGSIYPCSGHALPEFKAGNIKEQKFEDIWLKSPILLKLRKIYPVDNINEKCSNCIVKHWCLGCRGEAYHTTHKLNSPDIQCESIKKAIIEMFWILAKHPDMGRGPLNIAH